jgi:hypothetical protein
MRCGIRCRNATFANVLNKGPLRTTPKSSGTSSLAYTMCRPDWSIQSRREDISRTHNKITKIVRSADLTVHDYDRSCYRMVEVVRVNGKSSADTQIIRVAWLNRYPLPTEVVCDRGTEFKGELSRMIRDATTSKRSYYGVLKPMLWSNGSTRPSTTIYGRCRCISCPMSFMTSLTDIYPLSRKQSIQFTRRRLPATGVSS